MDRICSRAAVSACGRIRSIGSGLTAVPESYFNVKKVNEIATG